MKARSSRGFTIVELLVVIIVIGVLAAISFTSYSGMKQRASIASIQSDLSNASTRLETFLIENDSYPGSVTDCPNPSTINICLKSSPGNIYSYSVNNSAYPKTYSLSVTGGSNIYQITSLSPKPTALASAPLNPVADWLAIAQGDHYGSFYNIVSHEYATVSRSTTKTIYDPNTQRIHDVPANTLGIRPRSDGKSGVEAEIEEPRTNYTLYSGLETDSDSDGRADGIGGPWGPGITSYTKRQLTGGVQGNKYQQFTDITASSTTVFQIYTNQYSGFSAGEAATCSAYVSGNSSGVTFIIGTRAYQDNTNLGQVDASITLTNKFTRIEKTFTSLPANTNKVMCLYQFSAVDPGDSPTMNLDALQLEKGLFATSYIQTTSAAVTRSADVITVPTSNWRDDTGTVIFTSLNPTDITMTRRLLGWYKDSNNRITLGTGAGTICMIVQATTLKNPCVALSTSPNVFVGRWANGGNTNISIPPASSTQSSTVTPTGMPATAYIGSKDGSAEFFTSSMQRFTVYTSALSDVDVATVANAVRNGP